MNMKQKSAFNRNFDAAILRALDIDNVDFKTLLFEILPHFEEEGSMNSTDVWMIHAELNYALRETNVVGYQEAIRLMSAGRQHYPLWARVKKIDSQKLTLEFSTQFKYIKSCQNQETGIPPFKLEQG